MEKQTLKFDCLINMAMFSRKISSGYLMDTNNFTLTGKFTPAEIQLAEQKYQAQLMEQTFTVKGM